MKILILGGDGMLGHVLLTNMQSRHNVKVTLRCDVQSYERYGLFNEENTYYNIDPLREHKLYSVLEEFRPDVVVNALGVIKQRSEANKFIPAIETNALFPHILALACKCINARLVQMTTDCVFSGKTGNYSEIDKPDADDLYGKTKHLGELDYSHCITLRTSFFGLELRNKSGLIEWFISQKGKIKGFSGAIYSGLSTSEMSSVIEMVIIKFPTMNGLWHVASEPIDKFRLLKILAEKLGRSDIEIESDDAFKCDRSLNAAEFISKTGYQPPSWPDMLEQLAEQINMRAKKK
ncbi:MAG: SDR family oxidoreductase [Gammaproteobacteria bacterium]|nr:SDR family oxidoreductase [Gammaproteobacteria bacterium]